MKSILYIIILSVIAPLFIACSEDLNLCAQQNTVVETDYSCDDVILQERNPSLPDVITGQPSFDEELTRSGEMIGGTDKYLGYGYKLLKGNYIPSDFDNFTHSILDIESLKEYDESYIDENYPNWNDQSSFAYYDFNNYTHFSSISKTVKSGFSLNLGFFSIGKKKTTTETFRTFINESKEQAYGEMNILFAHGKFTLLSSNGSNKVFARQFLRRSFINNLYTSPISLSLIHI